jgi:hypothetical protein
LRHTAWLMKDDVQTNGKTTTDTVINRVIMYRGFEAVL